MVATIPITTAMLKPSPSALASQPVMIRLRTHSIRYETGFTLATNRNQSTLIRSRGVFIDERKRKTKSIGKRPWIASPEPVRSASQRPRAPKLTEITAEKRRSTRIPSDAGREVDADDQADGDVERRLDEPEDDGAARAGPQSARRRASR